jgi:prophage DNA circulation protein
MVCRDWASTLRRASYRGAAFFVESDSVETGRRLVVHEFPHKDAPYVEDMGRRANTIDVTAYVATEDVEGPSGKLFNACHSGGPAQLNLPTDRMQAHCESCSREYSKDRLGYIAFRLRFIRHGAGAAPFAALGSSRAITFEAAGLVTMIGDAFTRQFKTIDEPGFVIDSAIEQVRALAVDFTAAVRTSMIAADLAAPVLLLSEQLYQQAPELTVFGAVGDTFGERQYLATAQTQLDTSLVPSVFGLFEAAREAMAPEAAAGFFVDWLAWAFETRTGPTPSMVRLAKNTAIVNTVVRMSAAAAYVTAIVGREYTDPRIARQARADVAEYLGDLLEGMRGYDSYEAVKEIYKLRGDVAEHLTTLIANMAPVLVVGAPRRMPALWWANRLYGDATRADEIVKRNGIKHASFMPTEFEALAR